RPRRRCPPRGRRPLPRGLPGVCRGAPLPGPHGRRLRPRLRGDHRRPVARPRRPSTRGGPAPPRPAAARAATDRGGHMIGYYVHHQGEGHRRRALAVARELRVPVTGLGTGDDPEGWPGEWVSLAPDDVPEVKDPAFADVTAGDILHWVPRHHPGLLERHRQIVEWIAAERPALVVVDISVEVTLLVRLCGIPVVVGAMPGDRTDPV